MHHFLIVEHDQSEKSTHIVRRVRIPAVARALPYFEAISMGLMPSKFPLVWHDSHRQAALRMTYHSSAAHRLLVGDPEGCDTCDTHDPFDPTHIRECSHAINCYRYTWYEAPDTRVPWATFIEKHYDLGKPSRVFSHGMTIDGNTVSMPLDVEFTAQEKACRASYHTKWWTPA